MKKGYFSWVTCILFATFSSTYAQQVKESTITVGGPYVINFSELAQQELLNPPPLNYSDPEADEIYHKGINHYLPVPADATVTKINLPTTQPRVQSPAPTQSFSGLLDNHTLYPPDVEGVAGPSHLMETINTQYRIFNKTGGTISTLSIPTFWSGVPNRSGTPFDPRIQYDAINSRWITTADGSITNGHYALYVAVSQTTDPTGSWFEYVIDTGSGSNFPDFPALGYNTNWVVMTTNDFAGGVTLTSCRVWVMNRASLYSGTLGTVSVFTDASGIFSLNPAITLDPSQTTEYLLADFNGNSGGNGFVRISTVTGPVGTPAYTIGSTVGVNQPWSETAIDARQKGTATTIETDDTRMNSAVYRNGSLWGAHHVYLPASSPTRVSADVWQIDPSTATVQQFMRIDDATTPTNYYYPTVAVDANNNALVGYTLSGTNDFASAAYSFRASTDPVNTLQSVFDYKAGLGIYTINAGGRIRWGDYSEVGIDPVDNTFWTLQEFANTGNSWGTFWAQVTAPSPTCTDNFEPNDKKGKAAPISVNTNINAEIATATDVDWYSFANSASQPNIKVSLTTLPADYDLFLYNSSGTQVGKSKKRGTLDEQIILNGGAVGTYKTKVIGFSGAFDAANCYTLNASISSTPFKLSEPLSSSNVDNKYINIYPNPNNGNMTLDYIASGESDVQLNVYNVMGKVVFTQNNHAVEGTNHFSLSATNLAGGIYVVEVKGNGESNRLKFMIEK